MTGPLLANSQAKEEETDTHYRREEGNNAFIAS